MRTAVQVLLLFLLLLAGCDHSAVYRFQVVDAATGRGLEGVRVEAPIGGHYFGVRALPAEDEGAAMVAWGDAGGNLVLNLKVEKDLHYYLFLTKAGYGAVTGRIFPFSGSCRLIHWPSDTLPAEGLSQELPEIRMVPGGVTVIPMVKLGS